MVMNWTRINLRFERERRSRGLAEWRFAAYSSIRFIKIQGAPRSLRTNEAERYILAAANCYKVASCFPRMEGWLAFTFL